MIIANGTIEYLVSEGGGIDGDTGHPLPVTGESAGDPIPCQFVAAQFNALARSNGEAVTRATWNIYIEQMFRSLMTSERIRLRDRSGKVVGDYSIAHTEPLEAVGEYRLTV